jgi:hypothetical protein
LLPNLGVEIDSMATALYGTEPTAQPQLTELAALIERRTRFHDWHAHGKPAEVVAPFGAVPDGEISPQFARCWQAAQKAQPSLTPRFALAADGFRLPLPRGRYRFERSVLLDPKFDRGDDTTVEVDPALLSKGGLYRRKVCAGYIRLESLRTAIPRWKVALRLLRRYRIAVRPELLRRMRSGVPFEFSRHKGALKVTLKAGRMPDEVRIRYRARAKLVRRRLDRVRNALAALEAEGERAAEKFAADPALIATQREAERQSAIAEFRRARDWLWRIARECYRRDSLPPWPFRTPTEVDGCARRGISSRQRIRLEGAIQAFTRAYAEVTAYRWNPLEDQDLTEARPKATPQRILALAFS